MINWLRSRLHTQSFTEVDYVKYGCDMVEFISAHTSLFEIVEHYNPYEDKSIRIVTISNASRKEMLDLITYSDNSFPMICKPVD
jgi:elongation factor P--beta-lysine ligase